MKKPFTWEHAPFQDCWKCKGKGTFGVLSIGGDSVTKRCTICRYSHCEQLPELEKRVIYLDQFAFSELHKLRCKTRKVDKWTPFWCEVDALLNEAALLQQIVLPQSNIHHNETIVSPFPRALRETQEAVGGDIDFLGTDDVQLRQIEEYARAYFAKDEPQVDFTVDHVLEGNRNSWLPDMRVTVGMDWSQFAPQRRVARDNTHSAILALIENWKQSGYGFDEVLETELGAYFASRQQALSHQQQALEKGLAENDIWAAINASHSLISRELEIVRYYAAKAGVDEDKLATATAGFWYWPKNREQPFGRILAYLFAALAAQFKGGRNKLPTPGFLNDVTAISAYLPYVDAMFLDKECAELLRHGRCRKDLRYRALVFSLNQADSFLAFLRTVIEQTPDDVRSEATALYWR